MGTDRISNLPDCLLTHILSFRPTKKSVRTSVLSKRWRSLWLNVPGLDLRRIDYPPYGQVPQGAPCYINTYLNFHHNNGRRVQTFKVQYDENSDYREDFVGWIETVVERGVQNLEVDCLLERSWRDYMTERIYNSNTLVSLKLTNVGLPSLDPAVAVSLPCLKTMHLEDVSYDDDDPLFMEKLISGCPVLEDFLLVLPYDHHEGHPNWSALRVRSQTLKSFVFSCDSQDTDTVYTVEIDAPQLKYMNFSDYKSDEIVLKNLTSLSMIEIGYGFQSKERSVIRNFLKGISSVRHMILSTSTLHDLFEYFNLGRIRKFNNLTRLQVGLHNDMVKLFPAFLESFPNLKNLILEYTVDTKEIKLSSQSMLLSLECVEIKLKEVTVVESVKTLVRYFLESSVVLKKLILHFEDSSEAYGVSSRAKKAREKKVRDKKVSDIVNELSTFTKLSPHCEITMIH
ncbi:hypothetical protein CARUB_v10016247mg [Capsella rubella]|uniref:FBD domain-containing protein n=1 Tax=Capsella rubella TaxID=81985 RepID=R0I4J7_9BRAS|nr:hypothetical protein CARUB_v10016247mg [Capsella rubella]